jgi:putative transposase
MPFEIDARVVLPDHMHAVWSLPDGDTDFPTRWRLIKTFFSRSLPATEWRSNVQKARHERGIWQRRYWEHLIRDERDYARHIDYCWFNPVKHGFVANVEAVLVVPQGQSRQPAGGRSLAFRDGAFRVRSGVRLRRT